MIIPRDEMSIELLIELRASRKYALRVLRYMHIGGMSKKRAAEMLMSIYVSFFSWRAVEHEYDTAHPCFVFASRILRCARILTNDEWVACRTGHV